MCMLLLSLCLTKSIHICTQTEKYTTLHTLRRRVADEIICLRVSHLWYHRGGTDQGHIKDIDRMVVVDSLVRFQISRALAAAARGFEPK